MASFTSPQQQAAQSALQAFSDTCSASATYLPTHQENIVL